jgi:putative acetyltransferase
MIRTLKWAEPADHAALGEVMFDAVRNGDSRYSRAQRKAWVPAPRSGPDWSERLSAQDVILAQEGGEVLGFMSLAAGGYIDFAYIRPAAQHSGLFRQMFGRIETLALEKGCSRLWTHASLMAEPAFAALGFSVRHEEVVEIGGERVRRFEMERVAPR